MDKDHPAKQAWDKLADKGGEEEPKGKGLEPDDFERDFDSEKPDADSEFGKDYVSKFQGTDEPDEESAVRSFADEYKETEENEGESAAMDSVDNNIDDYIVDTLKIKRDTPEYEKEFDKMSDEVYKQIEGGDKQDDGEKMDPEKYGYSQTLNKQSGFEFQDTVHDYLDKHEDDIPEESKNDIETWLDELDSGAPEDREEELEQKIADEIEGLEANNESIKIINGKKYKAVKEHAWDRKFGEPLPTLTDVMKKKVTKKHILRENYERIGGK